MLNIVPVIQSVLNKLHIEFSIIQSLKVVNQRMAGGGVILYNESILGTLSKYLRSWCYYQLSSDLRRTTESLSVCFLTGKRNIIIMVAMRIEWVKKSKEGRV